MKLYSIILLSMFSTCIAMEKLEKPIWKNHGKLPAETYKHFAKELITNMKKYLPKQKQICSVLNYQQKIYKQSIKNKKINDSLFPELLSIYNSLKPSSIARCELAMEVLNKSEDVRQRTRATLELHKIILNIAEASMCEICNCKEKTTYPDIDKWIGHKVPIVSSEKKEEALKQLYNEKDDFNLSTLMEGCKLIECALDILKTNNDELLENQNNLYVL